MDKNESWETRIEALTQKAINYFGGLDEETLNRQPDPKTWSIAENLEHLIILNSSYFSIFSKLEKGSFKPPFIARFPFFTNLFGNMIYNSVSDGGKKKVKTVGIWKPKGTLKENQILSEFKAHQDQLKDWAVRMKPFADKGVIIHSPANKLIVYSLTQAFKIILAHEDRHLEKAKTLIKK